MKKNGYLFIVVALTAIALIGFHATAFGADCTSICQNCHTATLPVGYEVAATAHPANPGAPVMCIECHQQNYATCNDPLVGGVAHSGADWTANIVPIACKGCHTTLSPCAPFITDAGLASYASVMHGGTPTGGPPSPDDVLPPDDCAALVLSATFGCGSVGGIETCNLGTPGHVDLTTTGTTSGAVITVWWGDGSGLNEPSAIHHTYNNIGRNQVIVTAANACGEKVQKVLIVNTTGGTIGKGTMTLSSTGSVVSYNVYEHGDPVSITSGNMPMAPAAPRNVVLDAGDGTTTGCYDVVIGVPSGIVPPGTPGTCSGPTAAACLRDADCPIVFGVQETCSVNPTAPTCTPTLTPSDSAATCTVDVGCTNVCLTAGEIAAVTVVCTP